MSYKYLRERVLQMSSSLPLLVLLIPGDLRGVAFYCRIRLSVPSTYSFWVCWHLHLWWYFSDYGPYHHYHTTVAGLFLLRRLDLVERSQSLGLIISSSTEGVWWTTWCSSWSLLLWKDFLSLCNNFQWWRYYIAVIWILESEKYKY